MYVAVLFNEQLKSVDQPSIKMAQNRESTATPFRDQVSVTMSPFRHKIIRHFNTAVPCTKSGNDLLVSILGVIRSTIAVKKRNAMLIKGRLAMDIE